MRLFRKKSKQNAIDEFLEGYELPSTPDIIMQLLSKLRQADASLDEATQLLEQDPGLYIRVLKTVNSAALGMSQSVSNVAHAARLLGRSRLETLVISVAVSDMLPTKDPKFDHHQFWLYAYKRAGVARVLARRLHPSTETESFAAGLLQDIGVPILADFFGEAYHRLYKQWLEDPGLHLCDLELESIGMDHATIGATIVERWSLGSYLSSAILGHHDSDGDVDHAVRWVSFLRPNVEQDGLPEVLSQAHSFDWINTDNLEDQMKAAMEDADEFARSFG